MPGAATNFDLLEHIARSGDSKALFVAMERCALEDKDYSLLFQTRLLEQRRRLGLPLMQTEIPDGDLRAPYERAWVEAAREAGGLYLAAGDIGNAWPFFRAIGDIAPVAAALENVNPGDNADRMIEIAFHEHVNPRKGFELVLEQYGMCRAITYFGAYPDPKSRSEALRQLIRKLYGELSSRIREVINDVEGAVTEGGIAELITGRPWLFEGMAYHTDPSHIASVVQFAVEATDEQTLRMALEIAEYGQRLSPMYHYRGEPPFEDPYVDCAIYIRALLGEDVDAAVSHFEEKIRQADGARSASAETDLLIRLLTRVRRYRQAVDVALEHSSDDGSGTESLSVYQLCEAACDIERWSSAAREKGNLVAFAAALLAR